MNKKWMIIGSIMLASTTAVLAFAGNWRHTGSPKKENPDAMQELKKIYARYMNNGDGYELSGTIDIYDEEKGHELKEQTTFRNVKEGSHYYSQLSQLQTFLADDFELALDTVEKTITLSGVTKEEITTINSKVFPLENYVADTSSLNIRLSVTEKGNLRILTIENDFQPEIKLVSVYYDPTTYMVEHTEIQWWKSLLLDRVTDASKHWLSDIRFSKKQGTAMNVKNEMDKIMTRKGNELSLTEKYKSYRVIVFQAEKPGKEN